METVLAVVVAAGIGLGAFFIYRDYNRSRQSQDAQQSNNTSRDNSNSQRTYIPAPEVVTPDVDNMSKAQLLDYARELNLKISPRTRKVEILDRIKSHLQNE